jgi:hypothetical protein
MSAYNPNKYGWGFATVVSLITAGLFFTAKTIHDRTYLNPRNPMMQQVYHERDAAAEHGGGEHGAAAGDHGAAAGHDAAPAAAHDSAHAPADSAKGHAPAATKH